MTLVSTYDGRVLWTRGKSWTWKQQPEDVGRMVDDFLKTLPPALPPQPVSAVAPATLAPPAAAPLPAAAPAP